MVALRLRSYLGQPGSPLVAKATQARVHGVGELLRRVCPEQRPEQRDVLAQGVEDEGDLQRVDGAEAPAELR